MGCIRLDGPSRFKLRTFVDTFETNGGTLPNWNRFHNFGTYFNTKQVLCTIGCLLFTPTYGNSMQQTEDLCPSALILSLAQCTTVASGCGSKCPQLQFRQSELSVFQCFDGSPGSGHLSAPLSLHLQPAVGGMTHTKTHSLSSMLAFSVPLK